MTTQQKKLFKRLAMRSLIRSVKKNGRAITRQWAAAWKPNNPEFIEMWEEAKKEVLK